MALANASVIVWDRMAAQFKSDPCFTIVYRSGPQAYLKCAAFSSPYSLLTMATAYTYDSLRLVVGYILVSRD